MPNVTRIDTDIEALLQPISEGAPSGAFLRYEGTYERIREARREDDATLPQGVWERPLKIADWDAVVALSVEALTHKSKDLQLAVWLGEAWTHIGGMDGFRQTIRLCAGLCERFWETLFPALDEGSAETRLNLLDWLDDVTSRELRQVPLTEPSGSSPGYCLVDWEAGLQIGAAATRSRAVTGETEPAAVTHESFLARLSMTGYVRWASMKEEIDAAAAAVHELEALITAKVPGASLLRRAGGVLRSMGGVVDEGLKVTIDNAPPEVRAKAAAGLSGSASGKGAAGSTATATGGAMGLLGLGGAGFLGAGGGGGAGSSGGPITSRTDAYVRLTEAADYLLRTEPHSPVPYLVKRAISWGNMSLAELLYEFVGNTDDLVAIQRLLGMRERE